VEIMQSKDLLVVRAYDYRGVKVLVELNFQTGKASLVERNGDNAFKQKKWDFTGRELDYMNGWLLILDAMKYAVKEAKMELQKHDEEKTLEFLEMSLALDKVRDGQIEA